MKNDLVGMFVITADQVVSGMSGGDVAELGMNTGFLANSPAREQLERSFDAALTRSGPTNAIA